MRKQASNLAVVVHEADRIARRHARTGADTSAAFAAAAGTRSALSPQSLNVPGAEERVLVAFAPWTESGLLTGVTYQVSATFSGAGVFGNKAYTAVCDCDDPDVEVNPQGNGQTTGIAFFTLYIHPDDGGSGIYGDVTLTMEAEGAGWTGEDTTSVAVTFAFHAIDPATGYVEDAGGVPSLQAGTFASRPAAGSAGAVYLATDGPRRVYRDNGSGWDLLATADHGSLDGLGDDDHTQYVLLAGRSGGQTVWGGTASGDTLRLESTSHATKGNLLLQADGGNVGIGGTPSKALHVFGQDVRVEADNSTLPRYSLRNTGAGANEGRWQWYSESAALLFAALNDAEDSQDVWLKVPRSGTTVLAVRMPTCGLRIGADSDPDTNYYLQLPNDATQKGLANAWDTYASSLEWKADVMEIAGATDLVRRVRGIRYRHRYPDIERVEGGKRKRVPHPLNGRDAIGVSAEEMDALGLPGLVGKDAAGGYASINLTLLVPVLVQALRELDGRLTALEAR